MFGEALAHRAPGLRLAARGVHQLGPDPSDAAAHLVQLLRPSAGAGHETVLHLAVGLGLRCRHSFVVMALSARTGFYWPWRPLRRSRFAPGLPCVPLSESHASTFASSVFLGVWVSSLCPASSGVCRYRPGPQLTEYLIGPMRISVGESFPALIP